MSGQAIVRKEAVENGVWKLVQRNLVAAILVGSLRILAPAIASAAPLPHKEIRILRVDRQAIENLQRWVSGGHDTWCQDAQLVASAQMRRFASEFAGYEYDLVSLPLETKSQATTQANFTYTSLDGRKTYHITLRRYRWLLPLAGDARSIIWVPSRIEIEINP